MTARVAPLTGLLAWRNLIEYARRPLNLVLLATVPVVFVALSAGALADFSQLLGAEASFGQLETVTAGWAAAFLAGVAGFFHVAGSRDADRRLASAGSATARVVTARLTSSLLLAVVAATGALIALVWRTDVTDLPRAIGATAMFAIIYLGIGAAIGGLVRSEFNGSLLLIFIWMLDVFLGPGMGPSDSALTRFFPTHFPTLVMFDSSMTHAGPLGDLGASLAWALGGLALAFVVLLITTRPVRTSNTRGVNSSWARLATGLRYAWREYRRNLALWVLLVVVPLIFISLSFAITPDDPTPVELAEGGRRTLSMLSLIDVHGAVMVSITVAFLAGLAGLFVVLGSAEADRRLVIAGFRTREVLVSRLGVIALAAVLVTGVSLAVTAVSFTPRVWFTFTLATLAIAVTYAMIGVVIGPLVGRLGGLYLMFLLPFIDLGLAQNIMFDAAPPAWASWLPGYGAVRVLVDGAFTPTFDETTGLLIALAWLVGIIAVAVGAFHRVAARRT
ncbi:ABC transporter permease [Demequina sp. TTPB684]|uniref:ABC transporter permease n=1 Tax=unclassified Demequina TaxID=2620311 RepID=UPI001CF5F46B|nr:MULTISPECIES: ABC transporter permease [unclassified Demequina]MCB2411552.1 ABC transporter permease [Demequina sp. TTPB684]UPU87829.1 ABC transporter permease [Demequina sp. TMPB413]